MFLRALAIRLVGVIWIDTFEAVDTRTRNKLESLLLCYINIYSYTSTNTKFNAALRFSISDSSGLFELGKVSKLLH